MVALTDVRGVALPRSSDSFPRVQTAPAKAARVPFGGPDYALLLAIAGLLAFGLIMVYSASVVTAYTAYRNQFHFFYKQGLSAVIGLAALLVLMRMDYHALRSLSVPALAVSIGMLAAVLIPGIGSEVYGAQRWIPLGSFQLQPSEVAKVAIALYVAHWLTTKRELVSDFAYGLVPFSVLMAVIVALLMRQPDMGTTIVVVFTAVSIFFAAGANLYHLALLSGLGALGGAALIFISPYRLVRVFAFLDPWAKPQETGYHVVQSLLAFGAGGVTGTGLGVGRQKFMYLPFPHTDSIFAVVGEELGLIGTIAIVVAFVFFAYRGLRIAWYAPDQFGRLLAVGVTCGIAFQAMMNMAVLTSSVPFTGITLPFISYGGSSLISTLAACGILLNVSRQTVIPTHGAPAAAGEGGNLRRGHGRPHLPRPGRRGRAERA
ncbi:MAG TPA: putative lipid II flippase FtsW [Chloroflexota bacterium]|nr:putative lipid II flippase FtsW [Chloroflexota bacterium]